MVQARQHSRLLPSRPMAKPKARRRGQRYSQPGHRFSWKLLLLMGLAVGLIYAGWQSWDALQRHTPPPVAAIPTPVTAFSLDEQARLLFTYDALQDLEKQQAYGQLYDTMTSPRFRETIDRKTLLGMADCADVHLGVAQGYRRPSVKLRRRVARGGSLDEVSAQVNRKIDPVWEKVVLRPNGMAYEVDGYYWSAPYPPFQGCLKGVIKEQAARRALEVEAMAPAALTSKPPQSDSSSVTPR